MFAVLLKIDIIVELEISELSSNRLHVYISADLLAIFQFLPRDAH